MRLNPENKDQNLNLELSQFSEQKSLLDETPGTINIPKIVIPSLNNHQQEDFHYEDLRGSRRAAPLKVLRYTVRVEKKRKGCIQIKYCLIFLLILFFLFLVIGLSPSPSGQLAEFKHYPMDSKGNFCGVGKLKKYPFLYLRNFDFPLNSVCVKKCPSFNYNEILGIKGGFMGYNSFSSKNTNTFFLKTNYDISSNFYH